MEKLKQNAIRIGIVFAAVFFYSAVCWMVMEVIDLIECGGPC